MEQESIPQSVVPEKRKTKSDIISHASVQEYLQAHARPNGGFKSFMHSNLFAALVLFLLGQGITIGSILVAMFMRTASFADWKVEASTTLKRMDEWGTNHGHYADERQDRDITDLMVRMKKSEEEGRQWEVIKTENNRLTKEVDALTHAKK